MEFPHYQYQFRVILIGDSTVGKSSLLRYFTEGRSEISDPTVGVDFYTRMIEIRPNYFVKLQLWDSAGQEKFRSITRSYYRSSSGVILIYDISSRKSFDNLEDWLNEAEANLSGPDPSNLAFLLIGHKNDLEKKREVLYEEGEYFAKYKKMKFLETSAVTGDNIHEAFMMIASEINQKFESGVLSISDGWDGIKCGLVRAQSITLSDIHDSNFSNCSC